MSTSWSSGVGLCLRWRRQRLPWALWIPAAATLSAGSMLGGAAFSWQTLGLRVLAAWLALAGLRLLDDLYDVAHDRLHHPERVLTQATSHTAPWIALAGMLLLSLCLLVPAHGAPTLLLVLLLLAGSFYRLGVHTRKAGQWLRLLKYPALVLALGGGVTLPLALASTLIYLGVCLDELLQEPEGARGPKALVAAALWLCALLWSALWWGTLWRDVATLAVSCAMASALCLALAWDKKGRWPSLVRGWMLASVLVLLLLPQLAFGAELF